MGEGGPEFSASAQNDRLLICNRSSSSSHLCGPSIQVCTYARPNFETSRARKLVLQFLPLKRVLALHMPKGRVAHPPAHSFCLSETPKVKGRGAREAWVMRQVRWRLIVHHSQISKFSLSLSLWSLQPSQTSEAILTGILVNDNFRCTVANESRRLNPQLSYSSTPFWRLWKLLYVWGKCSRKNLLG